jgi:uncharacterized protein
MEINSYRPGTPCWAELRSPDVSASKDFYAQLLGWDYQDAGPESGGYQLATVRGKYVAGLGPFQKGTPTVWTTYVAVADVDATARGMPGAGLVNEPGALCWNELDTRDPDRAADFYAKVFGWRTSKVQMGSMTYTLWHIGDEERPIGGMMTMDENWPAEVPPHWDVCFAVHDTDAAVATVRDLGGTVHFGPHDIEAGRFAAVADRHGTPFSIIKPTM